MMKYRNARRVKAIDESTKTKETLHKFLLIGTIASAIFPYLQIYHFYHFLSNHEPVIVFKANSGHKHARNTINSGKAEQMEDNFLWRFENIEAFASLETQIDHED